MRAPSEHTHAHADADLLITHFGAQAEQNHRAYQVLGRASAWASRPPVIVFAAPGTPAEVQQKRMSCLRRGAFEYATEWPELYRLIESLFGRIPGET